MTAVSGPSRDPAVSDDDIVILRTGGAHSLYQLHIGGVGPTPEQFSSFELASVRGDAVARKRNVRLFYIDSPSDAPFVLRDYSSR
jgi:hypothetical protein